MKPFKYPRLWLSLWLAAIAAVVALSLLTLSGLPELPSGSDKVEHFLAYFLLSATAVQLFSTRRAHGAAAVGLIAMGIALEFAQGAYTTQRMQDPFDALANTLGVLAGLTIMLTPLRDALLRFERRIVAQTSS